MENTRQLETLDLSKLHRYSVGIVVEDNINNDTIIKIYPIEKLFNINGKLNKETFIETTLNTKTLIDDVSTTDDIEYIEYKVGKEKIKIDKTNYLFCSYLNKTNNNLILPPNVCKGEKVMIYRFSNRDEYYWTAEDNFNDNLKHRKEEHIVYTVSDKPKLDITEDEIEDRYTITFSTRDKYISLHTTDKYGEYTTYDFKLNTKDGIINLIDGKDNELVWDSTKDKVSLHIEGSSAKYDLEVAGDDGYVSLLDNKNNSIKLDSKADSLTANINKTVTINTKDFNVNCTNYKINTTNYTLTSKLNLIHSTATRYDAAELSMAGVDLSMTHYHIGNLGLPTSVPNDV